ncbi:MAG: helix-turn-helix domain-containing protein [Ruminococcaceae bacterium]|nr:helix-turn-helix domain-containing protein [Oscillospiraceae bacterium]
MTIEMADRLVALRRARGLSQSDVARQLGVSRQAVSKWEQADSSPDTDNLIALLRLYGVTWEEFLGQESSVTAPAAPHSPPEPDFSFADEETPEEREVAFAAYLEERESLYGRGKRIVRTVIVIEAIFTVISFLLEGGLLSLALSIVTLVCLWKGKPWARWLFVVQSGLGAFSSVLFLTALLGEAATAGGIVYLLAALIAVMLLYCAAVCVLFFRSRAVEEYLYAQYTE